MLRGDVVKDDSRSHAEFTEQGSSVSHMTAAKFLDVISKQVMQYRTQVKNGRRAKLLGLPESECTPNERTREH